MSVMCAACDCDTSPIYRLNLSNGISWSLHTEPETAAWGMALAHIMCLPTVDGPADRMMVIRPWRREQLPVFPDVFGKESVSAAEGWQSWAIGSVLRMWRHPKRKVVLVELTPDFLEHTEIRYITMWSTLRLIHLANVEQGGALMHATLAELDGKGILIAAAGDTGKSTCYRRLPAPWKPLCDDQVLVLSLGGGRYMAHPFPTWSDYLWRKSTNTWNCSVGVPLKAVFFLEQASNDAVIPLQPGRAVVPMLNSAKELWQTHWSRLETSLKSSQAERVFGNALAMAKTLPAYRLQATLHGQFWKEIEKVL